MSYDKHYITMVALTKEIQRQCVVPFSIVHAAAAISRRQNGSTSEILEIKQVSNPQVKYHHLSPAKVIRLAVALVVVIINLAEA